MIKNFVVAAAVFFLNFGNCAAEDLKFIDSQGEVGYFVDMDSVRAESAQVFRVDMAIIRLNLNQMEVVNLRINHAAQTYEILSTKTLSYDERTEIKSDDAPHSAKSYSDKSLMGDIVQFVIYGVD